MRTRPSTRRTLAVLAILCAWYGRAPAAEVSFDRGSVAVAPRRGETALAEDGRGHPLHWKTMPVRVHVVAANAPDGRAGEDAVRRAFDHWSGVSERVRFELGGEVDSGAASFDGRNVVYWIRDRWPFDPDEAAVTLRAFDTATGELLEADILLNAATLTWSVDGEGYDVESVVTHEVGHLLGLGHSEDPLSSMHARIHAGDRGKRRLSEVDRASVRRLYGADLGPEMSAASR